MWPCGANICFSSVNSHKPRKTLHNQFPVPLTMHRNCKRHILKSNTPSALHCVYQHGCLQFLSPYYITVLPTRLSTVPFTTLHYSVFASKAVYSSCHNTALQCVRQQGCLQFLSPYCITVCVCQQGCLQFLSPYSITVCVPARLSTVPVTILHYSVCASKAVYSSCHHTALQCVCQQDCLQFLSPYYITVCVPARLCTVPITTLHYSVCASKVVYSSCHHTALQCVCQQGCLQFLSPRSWFQLLNQERKTAKK